MTTTMTTTEKVLLFSVFHYERKELDAMSEKERYELASMSSAFFPEEANVMSRKEYDQKLKHGETFDCSRVYFTHSNK